MKKFIALIMAVIMVLSLVSCGQQTGDKAEEYTRPDLTYWRENLESAVADLGIGLSSHGGITTAEEVFALMESIEFYGETSVEPIGGMDDICHSMRLTNWDEDKSINFTFYNDFYYVAIDENGTKVEIHEEQHVVIQETKQIIAEYDDGEGNDAVIEGEHQAISVEQSQHNEEQQEEPEEEQQQEEEEPIADGGAGGIIQLEEEN